MAERTPWLVVEQTPAPGCPPGVHRCRCLRCGDMHDTQLPMGIEQWVKVQQAFGKRHAKCKETPR